MFGGLGLWEVVLIFFIILLVFGAPRIPRIARGLGEGIRNFKSSVKEPDRLPGEEDASGKGPDPDA